MDEQTTRSKSLKLTDNFPEATPPRQEPSPIQALEYSVTMTDG